MPLPVAAVGAFALRAGAVALAAYAVRRVAVSASRPGRIDQRAEDALDDVDEGASLHRPKDRPQHNAAARLRRQVTIGGRTWDIDLALLGRLRVERK